LSSIDVCGDEVLRVDVEVHLSVEHLRHKLVRHFVQVDKHTFSGDEKSNVSVAQENDTVDGLANE
jgi:hypothetical protein